MNPTRRLAPFLLPIFFAPLLMSQPGRAQTPDSNAGYAFADTTLLRDTLGLSFPRLFRLADSLHEAPDTLRALSIRYRWTLGHLVELADSLGTVVDSVGPILTRERFNPLLNQASTNQLNYQSLFAVDQQSNQWTNSLNYNFSRGGFIATSLTTVYNSNTKTAGSINRYSTTSSATTLSWRVRRDLSAGVSANLNGVANNTPGSIDNLANTNNNFGLTLGYNRQSKRGLATRLNFIGGVVDASQVDQSKRGLSGEVNGSARYLRGSWFTSDLNARVAGNVARLSTPFSDDGIPGPDAVRTHDLSTDLRGVLGLWPSSPIGVNVNYRFNNQRVATAGAVVVDTVNFAKPGVQSINVQDANNGTNGVDATIRLRRDSDRQINFTGNLGTTSNATAGALSSIKTVDNSGVGANGNYLIGHWTLQGAFSAARTVSAFPRFAPTGGYQENQEANSLNGSAVWNASQAFTVQFLASIGLTSFRYETIGSYLTTPVPHDQYSQSYSIWPKLVLSRALSTDVRLEVQRSQFINIPATSTASNNEGHTYRATWNWSLLMFEGFTVNQSNQLGAVYTFYPFVPTSNRLALNFSTLTSLRAVLNPRLTINSDVTFTTQPSGNYLPQVPGDPTEYFSRADEDNTRQLNVLLSYTPAHAISFRFGPQYLAIDRNSTVNGVLGPERKSRSLQLVGGGNLNVPVAKGCTLTGTIDRTYRANRSTSFGPTASTQTPLSESDFWNGSLTLNWTP